MEFWKKCCENVRWTELVQDRVQRLALLSLANLKFFPYHRLRNGSMFMDDGLARSGKDVTLAWSILRDAGNFPVTTEENY